MCGGAVQAVTNTFSSAVSAVSNGVNNVAAQVSNSDVGKFVGNQAGAVAELAKSPIEIAYDVSRGDIQHAGQTAVRGYGAAGNLATGGTSYVAANYGKEVLTNPYADKLSFGITKDYYGASMGLQQAQNSGRVDQEYWNDTSRLGVKVGAIAAGAAYFGAPTRAQAGSLYGSAQAAAKGDYLGAVTGAAGSNYFGSPNFDIPKFEVPDWMNDVSKYLPSNSSSGPSAYPESSTSPYAGAGSSSVAPSSTGPLLMLAALGILGYIVVKKVI
jgi:hypothetical protein